MAFRTSGDTLSRGISIRCSLKIVKAGRPFKSRSVVACAMSPTRRSMSRLGVDAIKSHVNHAAPAAVVHEATRTKPTIARATRGRWTSAAAARVDHTAEVAEPRHHSTLARPASPALGRGPRSPSNAVADRSPKNTDSDRSRMNTGHHGSFSCLLFRVVSRRSVTDLIRVNPCRFVLIRDGEVRRSRRVPSGLVADRHGRWSPSNADADRSPKNTDSDRSRMNTNITDLVSFSCCSASIRD